MSQSQKTASQYMKRKVYKLDNEQYFIGQCLWQPDIIKKSNLNPEDFCNEKYRKIFNAMLILTREGAPIDEGPLAKETGYHLEDLMAMKDSNILPANWKFYEHQILEATRLSKIRTKFDELLRCRGKSADDLMIEAQMFFESIVNSSHNFGIIPLRETVASSLTLISERASNRNKNLIGIPSGIRKLDEFTAGFQPRKLYVIGARPSQGKTALLVNCIRNCDVPCGVLSAESAKEELLIRIFAGESQIDSQRLAIGLLRENEVERLNRVAEHLFQRDHVYIYDEPNMEIDTATRIATQMVRNDGIKILFVDYLQCFNFSKTAQKAEYREKIAYASKLMKQLARTLNIPVVVAAQLRREAEGTEPKLSDFSDSTQIERDADVAILINNKYKDGELESTELLIAKNRDGRTGVIPVIFDRPTVTFR